MKIKRLAAAAAAACALFTGGCAIVSSVSQVRENVFTVDSLGNMGQPGSELLYELYEKGEAYCQEKGMDFKLLSERTNDGTYRGSSQPLAALGSNTSNTFAGGFSRGISAMSVPMGSYGRARIWFTCVKPEQQAAAETEPAQEDHRELVYSGDGMVTRLGRLPPKRAEKLSEGRPVYTLQFERTYDAPRADGSSREAFVSVLFCKNGFMMHAGIWRFDADGKLIFNKDYRDAFPIPEEAMTNAVFHPDTKIIYEGLCGRD